MQADLQHELEQLGFTERQACVYVALLRFGKCGALQLSLASGVPRASCYDVLQHLAKQGLTRMVEENGQQVYLPEPPERIGMMLNLQLEEIQSRRLRAEKFLPQLSALTGDGTDRPRFRIITDATEVVAIHAEYAAMQGPILQLVGYDAFLNLQKESVVREQNGRLQEKQSKGRAILITDSPIEPPVGSSFEVRCVPPLMITVEGEMTVCEDHVLLFSYTNSIIAMEIISATMANTCRATLELAWQQAGEIQKQLLG